MWKSSFFKGQLIYKSRKDLDLEKRLSAEELELEKQKELPFKDYYERRMVEIPGKPEDLIPDYNKDDFERLNLLVETTMSDNVLVVRNMLYRKSMLLLAKEAISRGCDYVVGVAMIYNTQMTSKSPSGWIVALGGSGFGSIREDGVYSATMGVRGIGLKK